MVARPPKHFELLPNGEMILIGDMRSGIHPMYSDLGTFLNHPDVQEFHSQALKTSGEDFYSFSQSIFITSLVAIIPGTITTG